MGGFLCACQRGVIAVEFSLEPGNQCCVVRAEVELDVADEIGERCTVAEGRLWVRTG
ncbi:MAG: hypothetical protein ABIK37_05160 [candidate division WOR-3 bacterium]